MNTTQNRKPRILAVKIEHKPDESPDTSWLGEYSNQTPSDHAINRIERGDRKQGECAYWEPARNTSISEWNHVSDADVLKAYEKEIHELQSDCESCRELSRESMIEALNAHYREQDYQRMEALNRGDWYFIGVIAKAEVVSASGITQHLRSTGLWGIESDSGEEYMAGVEQAQLAELAQELESFGFSKRAAKYACNRAERKTL